MPATLTHTGRVLRCPGGVAETQEGQGCAGRSDDASCCSGVQLAEMLLEQLHPRREGGSVRVSRRAGDPDHQAAAACIGRDRVQHGGLADARLAGQQQQATVAGRGFLQ